VRTLLYLSRPAECEVWDAPCMHVTHNTCASPRCHKCDGTSTVVGCPASLPLWLLAVRSPRSGRAAVAESAACGPAKHSSSGRTGCVCPKSRPGLRHVALRAKWDHGLPLYSASIVRQIRRALRIALHSSGVLNHLILLGPGAGCCRCATDQLARLSGVCECRRVEWW
jgi:hypothetical protein